MNFSFSHVAIARLCHVLPPVVITSEAIEQRLADVYRRLHLPFGRIELMTGIRERRAWPESILASQASTLAAKEILKSVPHESIDLLVHTAVCRDRLEPATAAYIHHNLSLPSQTMYFDLSNACLGFLNALLMVAPMIESRQVRSALIVSGENGKPLLDNTIAQLEHKTMISRKEIKSYFANLTIGSGAVAALVTHDTLVDQPAIHLQSISALSDTRGCTLCQGDNDPNGLTMETDSSALLDIGIQLAQSNWKQFLDYNRISPDDIRHFICHQVGLRHRSLLYQALGIDLKKDYATFPFLGNTGSVALPITLSLAIADQHIKVGDNLALLGIGSGVSSLMMLAKYR